MSFNIAFLMMQPSHVCACPPQETLVTEYLNSKNLTEAVRSAKEMKAPKHFLPEMLSKIIVFSLDRPDEDKERASTLIHTLHSEGLVTAENFMQVHQILPVKPHCTHLVRTHQTVT